MRPSSIPRFRPPSEAIHRPEPDEDDDHDRRLFHPRGRVVCGRCHEAVCVCVKGEVREEK
jgi:hypothetical protein